MSSIARFLHKDSDGGAHFVRPNHASIAKMLELLEDPYLVERKVTSMCWSGKLGASGLKTLVASPAFVRFRALVLVDAKVGDEGLAVLANSPHAHNLQSLKIWGDSYTAAGINALLGSELAIKELLLQGLRHGPETAVTIAGHPGTKRLRSLVFQSTKIGNDGLAALARSPHLAQLEVLEMDDCKVDASGVMKLAETSGLASLTSVGLSAGKVTAAAVRALAKAAFASRLEHLRLSSLGDDGLTELARATLPALRSLDVIPNVDRAEITRQWITGRGLIDLVRSESAAAHLK